MDFQRSEDQTALAEGIRALVAGRFPLEAIRAREGRPSVVTAGEWAELGAAGVFSLTRPEAEGGVGLGVADATVVFEELGRALVPGPLVGTFLAAGLVDGAADGAVLVGVHTPGPGGPGVGDGPLLIEHLGSLGALLVVEPGGAALLGDPGALAATALDEPLDPLTPVWRVDEIPPAGTPLGLGRHASSRLWATGAVLTAALQVGHAAAVLELAVAYAGERHQFGRAIGSFQAVKHLCADMLVRAEVARSAVAAAGCLLDQPEAVAIDVEATGLEAADVVRRAVLGAALLADEAALANARSSIQVHGGMGFTWEVPVHLHLKRSRVLATTFGSASDHAATLASLL